MYHAQGKGSMATTKTRQRLRGDDKDKAMETTKTRQRIHSNYQDKTNVPSRLPEQDKGSMAINQDKAKIPWR